MTKLIITFLILTSNIALATGSDGSSGNKITSEPTTKLFCFKTGTSGTNGEKTGSDGSQGGKGQIVCVVKEKT